MLQIIEKLESVRVTRQGIPIEVAMTQNFHHLGVLRSIAWGIGQPDPGTPKNLCFCSTVHVICLFLTSCVHVPCHLLVFFLHLRH
jgi:hypothetical protein